MALEIEIKKFENKYYDAVSKLYSDCFSDLHAYEERKHIINKGDIVIALDRDKLIGFGSNLIVSDMGLFFKEFTDNRINYSNSENFQKKLLWQLNLFPKKEDRIIQPYENQFTIDNYFLKDNDINLAIMIVDPDYRRQGAGIKIAEKRTEIAKDKGANVIFVDCKGESHSDKIYEKLGFEKIMKLDPIYRDGDFSILMGLYL